MVDSRIYRFDNFEVNLSRECLSIDGEERHLRQKAFQVLIYLLARRERLVSKSELFESVWQNTAVTDDVLVQCVKEIRRAIGDDTRSPRFIKTVPKSGYRFIGEVEENSNGRFAEEITKLDPGIGEDIQHASAAKARANNYPGLLFSSPYTSRYLIAGSIILVFAAVFYFAWPFASKTSEVRLPAADGRKTVAVMFFDNQSKSPDFDWLREGLADMLSAGLSRSDKLTVLGRDRLHALLERNEAVNTNVSIENAADIARQSRAEFVVSGGFAHIGESIRLDVRLYDGTTGNLMTTESLTVEKAERLLTEIDLLSLKISNRLNAAPVENRDMATVMTNNLEAYRYYSLAVEKAQALHNTEAIELLQKAVALDPEFAMAHARIGYAYAVTAGHLEQGKPYLEKAFQLSARLTEKDRMNIAAWYAIAHQDFAMAIQAYREIIQRFPLEIEAYSRLARLLQGEERFDEALEVLRHGLTIDADAKDLYNTMGSILSAQGKHAEAIMAHERYVGLAPQESNAYDSLGLSYAWSGNYGKAIENYNRALEINPKFEIAIIHLANARLHLGQYTQAISAFRRYVDVVPSAEKSRGQYGIAFVYLQKHDPTSALMAVKKSPTLYNYDYWYSYLISRERGETKKARAFEAKILAGQSLVDRGTRPNSRLELYYRGEISLTNGQTSEALDYFRQTISHAPPVWHHSDFEDCLANAYLKLGRYDEAIAEYQRILQINPNYPLAHYYVGKAFQAKGLPEQARTSYLTFLQVWSNADADIPEVIEARRFTGF